MRSIKEIIAKNTYLGVKLRYGRWYEITLTDNRIWIIRYHSMDLYCLNHLKNSYFLDEDGGFSIYPPSNGVYNGLCGLTEISNIRMCNEMYVKSLGIII